MGKTNTAPDESDGLAVDAIWSRVLAAEGFAGLANPPWKSLAVPLSRSRSVIRRGAHERLDACRPSGH
jgi:hypothetical protein